MAGSGRKFFAVLKYHASEIKLRTAEELNKLSVSYVFTAEFEIFFCVLQKKAAAIKT